MPTRILVIDNDPHELETVCRGLVLYDYDCLGVPSTRNALVALEERAPFDLVLADLSTPGRDGQDLVERIRTERPEVVAATMARTPVASAMVQVASVIRFVFSCWMAFFSLLIYRLRRQSRISFSISWPRLNWA